MRDRSACDRLRLHRDRDPGGHADLAQRLRCPFGRLLDVDGSLVSADLMAAVFVVPADEICLDTSRKGYWAKDLHADPPHGLDNLLAGDVQDRVVESLQADAYVVWGGWWDLRRVFNGRGFPLVDRSAREVCSGAGNANAQLRLRSRSRMSSEKKDPSRNLFASTRRISPSRRKSESRESPMVHGLDVVTFILLVFVKHRHVSRPHVPIKKLGSPPRR